MSEPKNKHQILLLFYIYYGSNIVLPDLLFLQIRFLFE